jgi:hypothetical protein
MRRLFLIPLFLSCASVEEEGRVKNVIESFSSTFRVQPQSYVYHEFNISKGQHFRGFARIIKGDDISFIFVLSEEDFKEFERIFEEGLPLEDVKARIKLFSQINTEFKFTAQETGKFYVVLGNTSFFKWKEIHLEYEVYEYEYRDR